MNKVLKNKSMLQGIKSLIMVCLLVGGALNAQNSGEKAKSDAAQSVDFAKPQPDKNAGVFAFETEEIDYGTIPENADGVRIFKFTNTGKSPIVITQVKTSCGCTVPTYSKEPVMAGGEGEIQIKYATNRIGKFTKTITIVSNASEPNKVIKIKGEVLKPEE